MPVTMTNPRNGDVRTVPDALEDQYAARGFEAGPRTSAPADLKGAALNEALESAGLPTSGTADEKRARLAEHQADGTPPDA